MEPFRHSRNKLSQLGKAKASSKAANMTSCRARTTNYAKCGRRINPERITIEKVASSNQKITMHDHRKKTDDHRAMIQAALLSTHGS